MNLFIRNLRDGHFAVKELFDINNSDQDMIDYEAVEPFEINIEGNKVQTEYYLDVQFNGKIKLECDRCLENYDQKVKDRFNLTLTKNHALEYDEQSETVLEIDPDAHEVDLTEELLGEIQLAIPMKHLHDKACKGLCSGCGTNLNKGECSCEQTTDPRMDALKELKKQMESGE